MTSTIVRGAGGVTGRRALPQGRIHLPGVTGVVASKIGADARPAGGGAAKFTDNGGAVIEIARLQIIYWGAAWSSNPAPTPSSDDVTNAVRLMLAGPYLTGLAQYRNIGRGHLLGATVIDSSDPPNPFQDSDVSNFINARIGDGTLPGLDGANQNLYLVVMPEGVVSTNANFIGEHTYYTDGSGNRVHFGWVTNSGNLDRVTTTLSHELVESCTDLEGSAILGVAGTCSQPGWCEIGDVCSSVSDLYGVTVQSFWSENDQQCIVPDWPADTYSYSGVQWTDILPANSTTSWSTYNWPEYLFVVWEIVPTMPGPGGAEVSWRVQIERASGAYVTYWIAVTNLTNQDIQIEGRYSVLGH